MDLFDQWNPGRSPTQDDETFLTRDEHCWLADKLFRVRRALASMQQDAPMQAALEHALRLVDALQAGLIHDYLVGRGDFPPYLVKELARPPGHAFTRWVSEISQTIEAKARLDCVRVTAHHLVAAVERLRETVGQGCASEVPLHQGGDEKPGASATRAEYQRVIEHLAALGVFLQMLHQTAYMPAYGKLWGLPAEDLEALGYPEGMPASLGMIELWKTSCIDELSWGQATVPRLFFALKQHALLNHYSLDFEKMDQVRREFQARDQVDPDEDLESLFPTARAIQAILEGRSPCECISTAVRRVVDAMEAIRSLAPQLMTN